MDDNKWDYGCFLGCVIALVGGTSIHIRKRRDQMNKETTGSQLYLVISLRLGSLHVKSGLLTNSQKT
ncbi:hypothetical protein RRG08_054502 [Elysia crispata]|uniref:Uncharacterized protein n=1 Tax=Elysia crispata TaxID=231223 RepID=A0AAE0YUS5_9GAST|nr:hypothetical protein RRG08_054502 [Elysia crispata]